MRSGIAMALEQDQNLDPKQNSLYYEHLLDPHLDLDKNRWASLSINRIHICRLLVLDLHLTMGHHNPLSEWLLNFPTSTPYLTSQLTILHRPPLSTEFIHFYRGEAGQKKGTWLVGLTGLGLPQWLFYLYRA